MNITVQGNAYNNTVNNGAQKWLSADIYPSVEGREYVVTDGKSCFMAYYGFDHKAKETEFQSTSDDFDSIYGCGKITHWMPLPEPPKEETK